MDRKSQKGDRKNKEDAPEVIKQNSAGGEIHN